MAYGDKRDFAKIDIYAKRPGNGLTYLASTTWARNLREARERFAIASGAYAASDLVARYDASSR